MADKAQSFAVGSIRFEVPAGFDDLTAYVFRNADATSQLTVHSATAEETPTIPEEALANYINQLSRLAGETGLRCERIQAGQVGTWPALRLRAVFLDRKRLVREDRVFATASDGRGLSISLVTPEKESQQGIFDAILASVASQDAAPTKTVGFIRHQVGSFTLEVPEALRPPTCYQFVSPDAKVRLNLQLTPKSDSVPAVFQGRDKAMEVYKAKLTPVATYQGMQMYELVKPGSTKEVRQHVCQASKTAGDTTVYLTGQCSLDGSDRMQQALTQLTQSIQERK